MSKKEQSICTREDIYAKAYAISSIDLACKAFEYVMPIEGVLANEEYQAVKAHLADIKRRMFNSISHIDLSDEGIL